VDQVDVAAEVEELENTYLAVVRDWGQSIESADSYTHGHCEQVANYALAVAEELKLGEVDRTTIRIGAYLHDLGKVRVPHEILNKAGPLTPREADIRQLGHYRTFHPAPGRGRRDAVTVVSRDQLQHLGAP
jgi:putative nucleotidyltransferase with HDIG domain